MTKRKIGLFAIIILMITSIYVIGPMDLFTHGYYADVADLETWYEGEEIQLPNQGYEIEFMPVENHLAGFVINLANVPSDGELVLTIYDSDSESQIEEIIISFDKITEKEWYRVYSEETYEEGKIYRLKFMAHTSGDSPYLQLADKENLAPESVNGNLLLGYAYAKSTFSFQEKVLISMVVIALGLFICSLLVDNKYIKKKLYQTAMFLLLTTLLTENYMYNSIDNKNNTFADFQADSEALVVGTIKAEWDGKWFDETELGWGLGKYDEESGMLKAYKSQYGLQGKILRHFARYMEYDEIISDLHLVCSMLTAIVFVVLVYLLNKKYNAILSGCFFITAWLSPWIVNFARNLYWVEFTWFLPMVIGCFCAWKVGNRKCRILSYVFAFGAITVKCLCGYEYISTIMLGMISFLLVDFIVALVEQNKTKRNLLFRTIIIIGMVAIGGFVFALMLHACLRGEGNVLDGIRQIYENDVLRRTSGGDLNEFKEVYWNSFNASVWETVCRYFHFPTEVITGVGGNTFLVLAIIPIGIFLYDYRTKKKDIEKKAMYVVFFLTSISWFVLAKSHSYIHVPLSYVLWYFGFIQICMYIIVDKIRELLGNS